MRKFSKRYVLVEEDVFDRRFNGERNAEGVKKHNPFTNPDVADAKKTRQEILRTGSADSASVHDASLMLQRLVQRYADSFAKATNKGKGRKAKRAREAAGADAVGPVGNSFKITNASQRMPHARSDDNVYATPSIPRSTEALSSSSSSPEDEQPLSRLKATMTKKKRLHHPFVSISPEPSLAGERKSISRERAVNALGGGYLTRTDVEKGKALLVQMRKSGLTTKELNIKPIEELDMSGVQVRKAIRDMLVTAPHQRKTDDQTVKKLVDYLKSKNVRIKID